MRLDEAENFAMSGLFIFYLGWPSSKSDHRNSSIILFDMPLHDVFLLPQECKMSFLPLCVDNIYHS